VCAAAAAKWWSVACECTARAVAVVTGSTINLARRGRRDLLPLRHAGVLRSATFARVKCRPVTANAPIIIIIIIFIRLKTQ